MAEQQQRIEAQQHHLDGALLAAMGLAWLFAVVVVFYAVSSAPPLTSLAPEPMTTGQRMQDPHPVPGP
jgi:hypothetical protein